MKIVLVEPLIPPNTGSIGRLCAATETPLILVEPLGFSLDDRYLKRAGLDYWPWIDLTIRKSFAEVIAHDLAPGARPWLFTAHAQAAYHQVDYAEGDLLVFGKETTGLGAEILAASPETQVRIPMPNPNIRSLNLAQCAAVALFEARRQRGLLGG